MNETVRRESAVSRRMSLVAPRRMSMLGSRKGSVASTSGVSDNYAQSRRTSRMMSFADQRDQVRQWSERLVYY